jgi:hypothetical protein
MRIRIITSFFASALVAHAVMFMETSDPTHNTSTPGDNSGWQYEGKFMTFLGVPIAPHCFITAKHFGGSVGTTFDFHGDVYTTIAFHDSPAADLRIWEVDHAKPFPTYAPLSSGASDIGAVATVFGRGTQRGDAVSVDTELKGWKWGPGDDVKRWGRNTVVNLIAGGTGVGELLYCDFDNPGVAEECHLSVGDSGGGLFVFEAGLWRLAGIHLSVDGPFRFPSTVTGFSAALFDKGGLEEQVDAPPVWVGVAESLENVPSRFYSSRISASLPWIMTKAPEVASLAPESYSAWQRLYFSPAQIALPLETGLLADFDQDGISNLLEFALNLDPIFNETLTLTPMTGFRGLPVVRLETDAGMERLTIEFVRRTAGSGAGLTYTPKFSSDLTTWEAVGTETVTAINPRWERVKVVDALTTLDSPLRFARLHVTAP